MSPQEVRALGVVRYFRRLAWLLAYPFAVSLAIIQSFPVMLRALPEIRQCSHVLVIPEGGFGHTIAGPDIFRRMHTGQRLACLIFDRTGQNHQSALLWPEIQTFRLPLALRIRFPGIASSWELPSFVRYGLARAIAWSLAVPGSRSVVTLRDLYAQVRQLHPVPGGEASALRPYSWIVPWTDLLHTVSVPPVRLPAEVSAPIRSAVLAFAGSAATRFAAVYVRTKGADMQSDSSSHTRAAGPLENYLPAIEHLVERGYVVLLTGDVVPAAEQVALFSERVVWAERLGFDRGIFSLFAGTQASVWVGNVGGGAMLPIVGRVPMLAVDAYPYGCGLPDTRVRYKRLRNARGELVPWELAFRRHAVDFRLEGLTLEPNSASEIMEAVRGFLDDYEAGRPDVASWTFLRQLPDVILDKHTNTTLVGDQLDEADGGRTAHVMAHEGSLWPRPCCARGRELKERLTKVQSHARVMTPMESPP